MEWVEVGGVGKVSGEKSIDFLLMKLMNNVQFPVCTSPASEFPD